MSGPSFPASDAPPVQLRAPAFGSATHAFATVADSVGFDIDHGPNPQGFSVAVLFAWEAQTED
jgi:hypothetical protein